MAEIVLYEKEGATGLITINRPERKNPLNMGVFRALDHILDEVAADADVRAVLITGAGNTFVSGASIDELLGYDTQEGWSASRFQQSVFNKVEQLRKPTIAAILGYALGGGLELALACTFRVASIDARLGFPELGLGIIPAFGGTQRLIRTIGRAKATEMLLFRSVITGEESQRIGLVNKATEKGQVLTTAREMAQNLASLSPVAVRLELELLRNTDNEGFGAGLALESALGALAVSSDEAKRLLEKFVSKNKDGDD